jgi:chromosome segregation ATPase
MASNNYNKKSGPTTTPKHSTLGNNVNGGNIETQLRAEIKQLTSALEETDQALDEWVAECERLQNLIKTKENEMKTIGEQMEELKQHSLKLEEDRNKLKSLNSSTAGRNQSPARLDSGAHKVDELKQENESLRAQLSQAQQWVKEGLAKLEAANALTESEKKKVAHVEKEKDGLMKGQKSVLEVEKDKAVFEASRLANVVHAHELEIASLRAKLRTASEELKEAEASAGKHQALNAVASFQAECASTDNDAMVHWLKSAVRWSSRL